MKSSYDYTKDDRYKSYEKFVYDSLLKLGFRITNVGTMYLKDIILFTYFNNYYEIVITKLVKDFMKANNISHISYRTLLNCIDYSIKNIDEKKYISNFKNVFYIEYNNYYNSIKSIIILFISISKQ